MYVAINKITKDKKEFTWTPGDNLIIDGVEVNPNEWDIIEEVKEKTNFEEQKINRTFTT